MGKRRRNERTQLACSIGFSKIRYCHDHNKPVKPVRVFGRKTMEFHCPDGCELDKSATVLKVPEGPQKPR